MGNRLLLKGRKALYSAMTAFAVAVIGMVLSFAVLTSRAETITGTIKGDTVNVRADASTTSNIVATKTNGETIQIQGQKTGADGKIWYQIYINATTVGYVRSDLATVTDGSVPDTINADGTTSAVEDTVTKVNPVSGSVKGGQAVRVRSDAGTSANIVASAQSGQSLTVNGTKTSDDGNVWYYVEFADGTSTVKGFIRSDFIDLSGDLVEVTSDGGTTATTTDTDTTAVTDTDTTVVSTKDYDTELEDGVWYLLDYKTNQKYSIESMFEIINSSSTDTSKQKGGTAKTVWLIIFIIISIAAIGAAAYFFLKLREAGDREAFAEADRERKARVNGASRQQAGGAQRPQGQQTQRTAQNVAQRPAQSSTQRPAQSSAQRPVQGSTQRPGQSGVQRPVQSGAQRPVQSGVQRPVQSGAQAQRPVQSGAQAQRPVQSGAQAQRPVQSGAQTQRPVQSGNTNVNRSQAATTTQNQTSNAPKNGYDEDDDFEFGFLNWDGDEKK